MLSLSIWVYTGLALAIFGSLATVWGPGVKDPVIRTINAEVASCGVSLVLLSYNCTLALLTLITTTIITSLILFRAISRLEEIGADV